MGILRHREGGMWWFPRDSPSGNACMKDIHGINMMLLPDS